MKKISSFLSIALVASLFVTTSCSDDDVKKSNTDLLTEKSWVITKAEIRTATSPTDIDVSSMYIMDYQKDNIITFSKDKTYKEAVGENNGDGEEENVSGTWDWKDGEKVLATTIEDNVHETEVITLTATTLKISMGKIKFDTNGDSIDDDEVSIFYTLTAK